ncbi:cupin domain-containing protein [Candidatus Omnitrophota bacterium]
MNRFAVIILILFCVSCTMALAQDQPDYSRLDPKPFDPDVDPDIDMFISHWQESTPRCTYGALIERDILTKFEGKDSLHPSKKGAVLEFINRLSYATLGKHTSTTPSTLKDEQVIFYIDKGTGTISGGGKTFPLREGVGALVPVGIEFTMENTGDDPLKMYVCAEPVPDGFVPSKEIVVKDESTIPISSTQSHWSHIPRTLFYRTDDLATLIGFCPIWFDSMTLGQPHSHGKNSEEIWFVVEGEVILHLGKELRRLSPGSAYKIPPNGTTPHSNINVSDGQIKLFWLMVITKSD